MPLFTNVSAVRLGRLAGLARSIGLAAVLLPIATTSAARAVEVRYETALLSHYVWRGITLTDDPVFQPNVRIAHSNGLTFEAWGNADLGDDNDSSGELNEVRLTLDYARQFGAVELGVGFTEYLFPNTAFHSSREVHLRARLDAVVSPRIELFYDVGEIDGGYARFALAHEREFRPGWRYGVELSAGYADAAFAIGRKAGLHDGNVELRLQRSARVFDIALRAGWTGSLDDEVLLEQPVELWGGLTVSFRL
jgi:hypothetical protein